MNPKTLALTVITFICTLLVGITAAMMFGGPKQPVPIPSINQAFKVLDFPDLPVIKHFTARDSTQLGYRAYPPPTGNVIKGSIVLIHGSAANSISMHTLAKSFAQNDYMTYALDMRGHGVSGIKGQIEYIGQLEDDLIDFLQAVQPVGKKTLIGFSAGGGFALRFASGPQQKMFAHYLLLSPFIHQDAPSTRPNNGEWVNVGVPRIIALMLLNLFGMTTFNHLPVTAFALDAQAQTLLTAQYSYALSQNFRPRYDYHADINALTQPLEVLAGQDDETLYAEQFATVFKQAGKPINVTLIAKTGHVEITQNPQAIQASIAAVERLNAQH